MAAIYSLQRFAHSLAAQMPEDPQDARIVLGMLHKWLEEREVDIQPRARLVALAGSGRPSRVLETSNAIPLVRPR